ncbi:alkaline phosphatase [Haloferula sp. BvORR071]|uniref:alkaline phosphatase n=1 Tax=Haloferula sp. BvORR071 TaxID=1396141 RepID=UPI00054F0ACA|nr:alkaline phosphatase [Haloferula sp. BvORR071]
MKKQLLALACLTAIAPLQAAPEVNIALPERFRLLTRQLFDLRVEASNLGNINATLKLRDERGNDITSQFGTPEVTTDNNNNAGDLDKAWVFRAQTFSSLGIKTIVAEVSDSSGQGSFTQKIGVQEFKNKINTKENIILFIGDAMGATYRDVGRIVAKSTGDGFREGFFDEKQQMDQMPYSGMVMTYAQDAVVPDSANTGTAWATGNKTINGALNTFPDNNDWKTGNASKLDNPRYETLWSYLKRLHGYKTGIVTTAEVTDATPAAEGGYSIQRALKKDIAKQYVDGTFFSGPSFDVILGGAKGDFDARTAANAGDTRNLINDLVAKGFTRVDDRTQLNALSTPPDKLIGLFSTGNMTVTYDKLGYTRPAGETSTVNAAFPNQPFLEEMTAKAIATLSKDDSPFILMVEGASIDKQSHANDAAGTLWDVIEFDKAIGVGRAWAKANPKRKTLTLVSADHDQSMHIIGVVDTNVPNATQNVRSGQAYTGLTGGVTGFPDYALNPATGYPLNTNRYRVAVGFRTGDHTGSTVPITAEGAGAALFSGVFDQTDIFFKMAKMVDSDTTEIDKIEKEKAKLLNEIIDQNYILEH